MLHSVRKKVAKYVTESIECASSPKQALQASLQSAPPLLSTKSYSMLSETKVIISGTEP